MSNAETCTLGSTLGARDFSSAVSGFWLRPTAENVSTFGQHRKFPPHARKTSGTQGRKLTSTIPKGGCGKGKLKGQMLNVGCEKVNVNSTELDGRIENLTAAYEKLNVESENLNVA